MVHPLSLDLRVRVAAALMEGSTVRVVAKRFDIPVASTVRIGQVARAGHYLSARKVGGNCPPARLRTRWRAHQHRIDPARLVFVDETWVSRTAIGRR